MPSELSPLGKEISKYRADGAAWCFLVAYSEMQEDRDILREILIKQSQALMNFSASPDGKQC